MCFKSQILLPVSLFSDLITGCLAPATEAVRAVVADEFRKTANAIDDSLQAHSPNHRVDSMVGAYRRMPHYDNPSAAYARLQCADSVIKCLKSLTEAIDSVKKRLHDEDTKGTKVTDDKLRRKTEIAQLISKIDSVCIVPGNYLGAAGAGHTRIALRSCSLAAHLANESGEENTYRSAWLIVELLKIQADVRNTEGDVVAALLEMKLAGG